MREWNYSPDHPVSLTLACDARLNPTDYTNDQIWELNLGGAEPPAVSIQTTFGLRARSCRIFPRFGLHRHTVYNPAQFHRPITIHQYFANFIRFSCKPFSAINVVLEYWVPTSQAIACRVRIMNTGREETEFQLAWAEVLIPADNGTRMSTQEIELSTVLAGQTTELAPVLFLTGGAMPGKSPYPSLDLSFTLAPRATQEYRWVHAALEDLDHSYALAKGLVSKNWDAEFARISRANSQRIEVFTGNPQWDNVIYFGQTLVDQLLLHETPKCSSPSFVSCRIPDQGFSLLHDGSDYNHQWNGLSALDASYLANFLLPAAPEVLRGILDNFAAAQSADGEIDMKPGLGGQRSQLLATPVLAALAEQYFASTGNIEYIRKIFPQLLAFYFSWFTNKHDRDSDRVPEWDQPVQCGYEDHPLFSNTTEWADGVDISTVESPDLCAYLYRESQALIAMAQALAQYEPIPQLQSIADNIKHVLARSWSDSQACFLYQDRDSHLSSAAKLLGQLDGSGVIDVLSEDGQPIRPVLTIRCKTEGTRPVQVYIHGTTFGGAHHVDRISGDQIRWHINTAHVTSKYCYASIEQIEITGLLRDDEVTVRTADLAQVDLPSLLPLWAGVPSEEQAKILTNLTIMNKKRFLSPYGLRSSIDDHHPSLPDELHQMQLPWSSKVIEGLVHYGERKKAAEVFSRMMKALVNSFESTLTLHQTYQSETGKPLGAMNTLTSLMPVGLFLNILGVKIINPSRIEITGSNPFPWPVTIKYRGLTIVQQDKKTLIIFADGQTITVENSQAQSIRNDTKA